ncbi:hypothetical protein AAG906_013430 [Vitis piasezkii]
MAGGCRSSAVIGVVPDGVAPPLRHHFQALQRRASSAIQGAFRCHLVQEGSVVEAPLQAAGKWPRSIKKPRKISGTHVKAGMGNRGCTPVDAACPISATPMAWTAAGEGAVHVGGGEHVATGDEAVHRGGELEDEVYMKQPKGFPLVMKMLWINAYTLRSVGVKFFLVLYVEYILLATNDKGLLHKVKQFLSKNFDMKDMGEASMSLALRSIETYFKKTAKKVMRYLQGTKDYNLMYRRISNLEVVGYSIQTFMAVLIHRSIKRTLTTTSIMEAEFISCFEATSHGVWLKSFIFGLRNNKSGSQIKHIDIKYLAIRKRVKEKKVVIEHISTELMIIDPLTKGMPPLKFKDHVVNMGLMSRT